MATAGYEGAAINTDAEQCILKIIRIFSASAVNFDLLKVHQPQVMKILL